MKIAEINVSYSSGIMDFERIAESSEAYKIFYSNWNKELIEIQEEFKVMLLNNSNGILGIYNHTKGGGSATVIDSRIIFSTALVCNAAAIILAHNHPSSSLIPSKMDIKITNQIVKAAELFEIKVLDHLIVTNNGYYSFSDEGLL